MSESESVWMFNPSLALAVTGTVVCELIFIAISYLTIIKYRAWFFLAIVIGPGIEVAENVLRCYSVQNKSQVVGAQHNSDLRPETLVDESQAPFVMTLTFTVLAPVLIAAGNCLLINRLIIAVLPPSNHRILKIPGRRLTPIFVVCDVVAF